MLTRVLRAHVVQMRNVSPMVTELSVSVGMDMRETPSSTVFSIHVLSLLVVLMQTAHQVGQGQYVSVDLITKEIHLLSVTSTLVNKVHVESMLIVPPLVQGLYANVERAILEIHSLNVD